MARLDDNGTQATIERSGDVAGKPLINIAGELDISTVPEVEAQLQSFIGGAPGIVFDLSRLEFMDSSGIAMLLRAAANTGSVEVRNPSNSVRKIITATGLTEVLRFAP
jgi:anti-anti-sigma factor